jgi:hypothetical protein
MGRAAYRVRQFLQAATARSRPADLTLARSQLDPNLYPLFLRLPPADQAHALRVVRRLRASGETDPDLLAAGLLHDVGKSLLPLRLLDRVAIVLGQALLPAQVHAWSAADPGGWRRGFVVACRHPEWGATMVADSGGSARLVTLVRQHQSGSPAVAALAALQAADGDS